MAINSVTGSFLRTIENSTTKAAHKVGTGIAVGGIAGIPGGPAGIAVGAYAGASLGAGTHIVGLCTTAGSLFFMTEKNAKFCGRMAEFFTGTAAAYSFSKSIPQAILGIAGGYAGKKVSDKLSPPKKTNVVLKTISDILFSISGAALFNAGGQVIGQKFSNFMGDKQLSPKSISQRSVGRYVRQMNDTEMNETQFCEPTNPDDFIFVTTNGECGLDKMVDNAFPLQGHLYGEVVDLAGLFDQFDFDVLDNNTENFICIGPEKYVYFEGSYIKWKNITSFVEINGDFAPDAVARGNAVSIDRDSLEDVFRGIVEQNQTADAPSITCVDTLSEVNDTLIDFFVDSDNIKIPHMGDVVNAATLGETMASLYPKFGSKGLYIPATQEILHKGKIYLWGDIRNHLNDDCLFEGVVPSLSPVVKIRAGDDFAIVDAIEALEESLRPTNSSSDEEGDDITLGAIVGGTIGGVFAVLSTMTVFGIFIKHRSDARKAIYKMQRELNRTTDNLNATFDEAAVILIRHKADKTFNYSDLAFELLKARTQSTKVTVNKPDTRSAAQDNKKNDEFEIIQLKELKKSEKAKAAQKAKTSTVVDMKEYDFI
ncbi:hypothetical protein D5R81_13225 [Parashewanella spongiae]|uniref:Uncharacterized protein n=1 Tax=Parashewanella spongiae TaxID=342950 RepID=A0A3A6T9G7_9GAMM|nr:hypothetical protein [Parashewanella spongiae]MCL1079057.1 hypothetical protein [Parashewanella spongiae]RJY11411.1 hypothetical protein D5R81_13225 [Parashewanella spongiae]